MHPLQLAGATFARLTVIKRVASISGKSAWLCHCTCGRDSIAIGYELTTGHTRSCGCLRAELAKSPGAPPKHGHARRGKTSRAYMKWSGMLQRCTNPNGKQWKDYGGRGIRVCKRWTGLNGFKNFYADMGDPPANMTLDRKNNDKNYTPGNTRWATCATQSRNKRNNHMLTHRGKTLCVQDWARALNISGATLLHRLAQNWPLALAFSSVKRQGHPVMHRLAQSEEIKQ